MYQKVLKLYKPVGKTPFDMIRLLRRHFPKYEKSTLGYAGRLDPMAEGLLLILTDDENKNRKSFERLEKEYEFEILFGMVTDTYDPLGIVQSYQRVQSKIERTFQKHTSAIKGTYMQPYPPYSSARVNGKPLFYWARHNKLEDITIPSKLIEIKKFQMINFRTELFSKIYENCIEKISKVHGDFRQEQIVSEWKKVYHEHSDARSFIATCRITCSTGTYVRSLAHQIGNDLGTGAIALSIKRTRIGDFLLKDSFKITEKDTESRSL